MCHFNELHFCVHTPWRILSTQPFSADGEGDFIDPTTTEECDCAIYAVVPQPCQVSKIGFNTCSSHKCCVTWLNPSYCEWAFENRDEFDQPQPGYHCPNWMLTFEIIPGVQALWADGAPSVTEPQVKTQNRPIPFPLDMVYLDKKVDKTLDWSGPEYRRLQVDCCLLFTHAGNMRRSKELLRDAIGRADNFLHSMEKSMHDRVYNDRKFSTRIHSMFPFVVRRELGVIDLYRNYLSCLGPILTFFDRYPEEGNVVSSRDGSYSISHSLLELGKSVQLDDAHIISLCDGPLRQSDALRKRYDQLKDIYLSNPRFYSQCLGERKRSVSPDPEDCA
ncbi:hypothetical protein B0H67DRAFT_641659 [Lasiosphaeris hirsuta]|uniref:Uncharacterized protein n=1 Tax=Lasiosphaeris hirsuta TaxID=260670 RepID=A0AA40E311_9PEZI|nr:hypothetical protein B0H67DRAFT_641659 [Lasiosphaeris hirsuta]